MSIFFNNIKWKDTIESTVQIRKSPTTFSPVSIESTCNTSSNRGLSRSKFVLLTV